MITLKLNAIKTIAKILVLVVFTTCIGEINYNGDILNMINQARTKGYKCENIHYKPVGELAWSSQLEKAALIQCNYMDSVKELNHIWKDGTNLEKRLTIVGYKGRAGENIAWGQQMESDVIKDWLNSPEHSELLMFGGFNIVAVARKDNYWTMVLGYK